MALNMLGMGGGVNKNLDATSNKVSAIRKDLEKIDKLLGQIGGKAGSVNSRVGSPSGSSGLPSSSMFGSGSPLFSSSTPVTTAPGWSERLANKLHGSPGSSAVTATALGLGSMAWNAMPSLQNVTTMQQGTFMAGLGMRNPDYASMRVMMNNAFGGYATSPGSPQISAGILSQLGIGNVYNAKDVRFMNSLGAASLLTGTPQDQLAGYVGGTLMDNRTKNMYRGYGIRLTDSDGRPRDLGVIANDIATRSMGRNWNQADLEVALRKGLGQSFAGLGPLQGEAIALLKTQASHGGRPISSIPQIESMGLTGKDNPNAISQRMIGSDNQRTAAYADPMLKAFEDTTHALEKFNKALIRVADNPLMRGLAYGRGATDAFMGTAMGGALGAGAGTFASTLSSGVAFRAGKGLLSKVGGKAGASAAERVGAKSLGRTALSWGGKSLRMVGKAAPVISIGINSLEGYSNARSQDGYWGGALMATGTGAVGGAVAGLAGGPVAEATVPGMAAVGAAESFLSYSLGYGVGTLQGGGAGEDGGGAAGGGSASSGAGLVNLAASYVGTPYVWGGRDPQKGWDCSGFTQFVFSKFGVTLDRTSDQQYRQGTPIASLAQARPGDLLFFRFKDGAKKVVNHVGIYMGDGKMVHAASRRSGTKVAALTKYFLSALVGIRRITGGKGGRSNNTQRNIKSGGMNMNSRGDAWTDANGTGASGGVNGGLLAAANIAVSSFGGLVASASSLGSLLASSGSVALNMLSGGGNPPTANVGSSGGYNTGGGTTTASRVDVKASSTAATGTALVGNSNAEKAYRYLEGKQFTDQAAAGVIGNLMQESGVNPRSRQNGGGPGRGIMQWSVNQRWKSLTNWANKNHRDPWALGTQLDWMYKEMSSYGVLGKLSHMQDVRQATSYFERTMEKAGKPNMAARYRYAEGALKSYGNDGNLKKYSSGAWAISNDQIAKIHQGEMILPASIAEAVRTSLRSGLQGGGGTGGGARQVVIQVTVREATDADAIRLAKKVKTLLDEDTMLDTIGGQ